MAQLPTFTILVTLRAICASLCLVTAAWAQVAPPQAPYEPLEGYYGVPQGRTS